MRIMGYQIRKMRAYGPMWWLLFVGMLVLAFGCNDGPTEPTTMREVPSESLVIANLKANGWNPSGTGGICNPGPTGKQAQVALCFAELWKAMAITGAAAKTCLLAVGAAKTPTGAWMAGSICSLGAFSVYEGFERYVEYTQVGLWANQSAAEIAARMRQAIYERMIREGKWNADPGCC